ncbi:MAG: hypothetical protein A2015_09010 [Spirochaetes bacterium GWF1_31_7]|nr:MAG: hypothetical protein A2Y30_09210 [Spirochaetes bacterium GWE1_32_154]OHD47628.1 MAG: hypothetical protein A2015_09010 [Spirochaetes bacterium GWF1_31_7]HBD94405.1 hypothetical protein [Spirochaetia bacterium]
MIYVKKKAFFTIEYSYEKMYFTGMNKKRKFLLDKPGFQLTPNDFLFFIGSCFSENISSYLKEIGIDSFSNPYGTVYNTFSIYNTIKDILELRKYDEADLCFYNGVYYSLNHSGFFNSKDKDELLQTINSTVVSMNYILKKSTVIVITPGSSVVYEYKGDIVANCHRIPAKEFEERLQYVDEVVLNLIQLQLLLDVYMPNIKIIYTISPVRHYPDRLRLNTISKSVLNIAIDTVCKETGSYYFPSYEMVLDQLSDYSYYEKDLIHINKKAISFVMKRFKDNFFSDALFHYTELFIKIKKMLSHKSFNPSSEDTFILLEKVVEMILLLENKKSSDQINRLKIVVSYRLIRYFKNNQHTDALLNKLLKNNDLEIALKLLNFVKNIHSFENIDYNSLNKYYKQIVKEYLVAKLSCIK